MKPQTKAIKTLRLLEATYGRLKWEPRRSPMHELISTMLSHRTTQANEAQAYAEMWERFGSWEAIMTADVNDLADTLQAAQFPMPKAIHIQQALRIILEERGDFNIDFLADLPKEEALAWLMKLPGVGIKTATLTLLFCFGKEVLPVDTHVFRVSSRLGIIGPKVNAEKAHALLLDMLPKDKTELFNFHKLMLKHGQQVCTWAAPKHGKCPLKGMCDYYHQEKGSAAVRKTA